MRNPKPIIKKKRKKTLLDNLFVRRHYIYLKPLQENTLTYVQIYFENEIVDHIRVSETTVSRSVLKPIEEVGLDKFNLVCKVGMHTYLQISNPMRGDEVSIFYQYLHFYAVIKVHYTPEKKTYLLSSIEDIGISRRNSKTTNTNLKLGPDWLDDTLPKEWGDVNIQVVKQILQKPIQTFLHDSRPKRDDRLEIDRSNRITLYGLYKKQPKKKRYNLS